MDSIFSYLNPDAPGGATGPLAGMKIAVQPTIGIAGWPARAGSEALAGYLSAGSATVIDRLTQGGAILTGLTHASELGLGVDDTSTSGRAVETKTVHAELMLDMAGEARLSACRGNLWGFKPSWGRVPHTGITGLIPSMEACGILAQNPAIIRSVLKTVGGADDMDFSQPRLDYKEISADEINPAQFTLSVIGEAAGLLSDDERKAFDEEIAALKRHGFNVSIVSWPDYSLCLTVHRIVGSVEASSAAGRYDSVRFGRRAPGTKNWNEMYLQSRGAFFGTLLKSYLIQGAYFQFERYDAYENACRIRARFLKEASRLFEQTDVLVFPSRKPAQPASLDALYEQFKLTAHANVTGCPALYMPSACAGGQGLEFAAGYGADERVIALGEYLHRQRAGGKL